MIKHTKPQITSAVPFSCLLLPVNYCHLLNRLRSPPQCLQNSGGLVVSCLPHSL